MPAQLKNGVQGAPGGYRKGAGRKTDLFKKKCAELASSPEFFKFAKRVFKGEAVEPHVNEGGVTRTEASVSSRTHLWGKLAEHGHGKPASVIDLQDEGDLFIGVIRMPSKDQGRAGGVRKS